ncbi:MAG: TIGR03663 family protein [Anaerolineae bacterium]
MESNVLEPQGRDQGTVSWLDRPILAGFRMNRWTGVYVALMLVVAFTRLWDLGSRSYSHDESIHAWEAWKLLTGRGYTHSPVYHGPFLYHITALVFALFGDSDVTGRLATSLAGIAIVFAPLSMRRWLGNKGILVATLLMAISPVLMHRSRFIRHDQFTILFNLILVVASLRYLDERKHRYLYFVAASLALGFAGKETTFITYAILGSFLAGIMLYEWLRKRELRLDSLMALPIFDLVVVIGTLILPFASPIVIQLLGHNPIDYTPGPMLFSLGISLVMFGIGAGIGLWWNPRRWLICAGIFWGIFLPFFTTMFTNGTGITWSEVSAVKARPRATPAHAGKLIIHAPYNDSVTRCHKVGVGHQKLPFAGAIRPPNHCHARVLWAVARCECYATSEWSRQSSDQPSRRWLGGSSANLRRSGSRSCGTLGRRSQG